ncbi:MAG: bifunctional (p)ppGpp synthetase/guanosine-3',5'-bis(diphosphate) 3'-pyrophosphohydrolase [Hydrogenophaga sp.]|jgi:GTP pyrophosphokinase|uniref:RelA/SpoT family protein n=1 Tax=Hydrogenophaga sp. TaxID=1904254 RepID=UPI002725A2E9|nr:bifunctional (p)ppGpp synthetase/guanosine-3',5'-bis(diphosphate) 3'-pyrophosphohydrolase [Hydrogenophaga sp.]MDO9250980.1 bifunctional (p)ppGpp synthetase/guanosine-3',5'-bis(diphosphate) 3'-pyrophosphohydrolase [Hydrogenophaga sp.]MDP2404913.1 bifunctional (p)ppGpp synthetase/guanosine-3',5'-bis(diphosphate) 3'-pyrophosphohydrolase [Hydrogenophaga sp.]MDZ4173395.1 bifunctional (p)ppGpp synthetase/guanosine-3',5'-bis(diphosphate) 3'-pyrophosphohydrolase [Hydrogenophaga sp.]
MPTTADPDTVKSTTAQAHPAASAAAASFAALVGKLDYLSAPEIESVRQAYRFADEAHLGQMRKNGDPYITHPIAVAAQCAEWKLDAQALMAALMHDAIEDCGVTKQDLVERFGAPVADLVDGLTKLEKLEFDTREQNQAESFRKMLLAMAKDVRVILIKLADRTHNMRTMGDMPRNKWKRISSETLEIYAPIAHRLGLNFTYRELQDLAFRFLHPWRYEILSKALNKSRNRRKDLIARVQGEVESAFRKFGLSVRTMGREKTLYSVYRKMDSKHLSFSQVTDIYGFRIVVPELSDCYTGMGVLHQLYKPLPGKFRDYVAIPKVNGYQSLHTTLIGPFGTNIEFQLRTHAMDVVAESGVAAHWLYKASEPNSDTSQRLGTQWLQSLLDIQQETHDASEFWDHIKIDLFPDAVYVFTPKSKIMALPRGATVMDFAYAIHSGVGNRAVAARINGEQRPLRTELNNGDIVEIITGDNAEPNPAWLSFVKTGRARSKIRHHLKTLAQEKSNELGERMLGQALRSEGIATLPTEDGPYKTTWEKLLRFTGNKSRSELLSDIGMGKRIASMVGKKLAVLLSETGLKPDALLISTERYASGEDESVSQGVVSLDGSEGLSVQYASCCKPIPGDRIVGYLGRGEGLTVHAEDCPTGRRLLTRDSERFLQVEWADEPVRPFETMVLVTVTNGKGVLARVASAIAAAEADITHVDMGDEPAQTATDIRFSISVRDRQHLADVLRSLKRTTSVLKAQRFKP